MRDIRPLPPRSIPPPPPRHQPHAERVLLFNTQSSLELRPNLSPGTASRRHQKKRRAWLWGVVLIGILAGLVWGVGQWQRLVVAHGEAGYQALEEAMGALKKQDIAEARQALQRAQEHFDRGVAWVFGSAYILPLLDRVPGLEFPVSGIALLHAGQALTTGALQLTQAAQESLSQLKEHQGSINLLSLLKTTEVPLEQASQAVETALSYLQFVHLESLPEEKQSTFARGEALLPVLAHTLKLSVEHLDLLDELLGGQGPRIYLFLFQNNQELRPTGGFIGSYAILDIHQGTVRRFFVDGIFHPDGQLKENIVPPVPLQKISAGWSLHDSNWFPDFPTSAEKARFFYEKTGGPTTDGVVALTPEVLKRLLTLVGPIPLPEYGVVVDKDNFLALIQEEVEVKYNKEENNPKKILGDLTGVIIRRLIEQPQTATYFQLANQLVELLNERHILLFARHEATQALIDASGWSGRILSTPYDYLAVIHTNINGYKTDGVIQDTVEHQMEITPDGTVLDTVSITRTHHGGSTAYDWWNKVNADYLRVYVPLGSELLSASGMTREFPTPPLDYAALQFRRDQEIVREESAIRIHDESGTRIGEEFGKTVFGNWVYVSPGEEVTVTYRYRLPFRVTQTETQSAALPFSVLYQKQSGTQNWQLHSTLTYPESLKLIWQSPENLVPYGRTLTLHTDLNRNVFFGTVFRRNNE